MPEMRSPDKLTVRNVIVGDSEPGKEKPLAWVRKTYNITKDKYPYYKVTPFSAGELYEFHAAPFKDAVKEG